MRGLNHLVLAGRDLDAMQTVYSRLGFTVTPRAQHPFGTGNVGSSSRAAIWSCFR